MLFIPLFAEMIFPVLGYFCYFPAFQAAALSFWWEVTQSNSLLPHLRHLHCLHIFKFLPTLCGNQKATQTLFVGTTTPRKGGQSLSCFIDFHFPPTRGEEKRTPKILYNFLAICHLNMYSYLKRKNFQRLILFSQEFMFNLEKVICCGLIWQIRRN